MKQPDRQSLNKEKSTDKSPQTAEMLARAYRDASPYLNIGWFFVIAILLGIWAGRYLDDIFECKPAFLLAGALFGLFLGFVNLYKTLVVLKKKK